MITESFIEDLRQLYQSQDLKGRPSCSGNFYCIDHCGDLV